MSDIPELLPREIQNNMVDFIIKIIDLVIEDAEKDYPSFPTLRAQLNSVACQTIKALTGYIVKTPTMILTPEICCVDDEVFRGHPGSKKWRGSERWGIEVDLAPDLYKIFCDNLEIRGYPLSDLKFLR